MLCTGSALQVSQQSRGEAFQRGFQRLSSHTKSNIGIFGYSHFTGGFAGGQAEYLRVPYGDVNLLSIPDEVPDEKALYVSDVIATSWHCVVDTGVKKGDVVAIWGAGPIGQMCAQFSFYHGASRVIIIDGGDGGWRLSFVKSKAPKVETLDYTNLPKGESVTSQLKKMVEGGPDVALECAAGEYAKGWAHYFEQLLGMETDTSELLNEMITAVRPFGHVGVTGVYAGFVSLPRPVFGREKNLTMMRRQITSILELLCRQVSISWVMGRLLSTSTGSTSWSLFRRKRSTRWIW
jgi:threonine dehydrogenase-like Zn-dependent dehydrogenase